jgi:hypothetical protein
VFADLSGISGTGAVWADFGGTLGKVVDTSGTSINGASLKEAIRRGQIITVHRGTDGTHPTLVAEKVENPADTGSSLTLDALKDVTAPANTPAGKVLGTTAVGEWGLVDAPGGLPPTETVTGYYWNYNGSGNATAPGDFKVNTTSSAPNSLRINLIDNGGADRSAWLTAITAGKAITLTQGSSVATFTVSGTPSTAGSGTGAFRSMSGAWTGDPVSSFTGPGVPILVSVKAAAADGSHLVLTQGQAQWRTVYVGIDLDDVVDVSAPANTPVGKFLGTTAVGEWGPVDAPNAVPMDPKDFVAEWSPSQTYAQGNLVWTEDADGNRYYFSSDIQQTGGTAPSLTNLATWTYISGRGLLLEATLIPVSVCHVAGSSSVVTLWQAMAFPKGDIVRHSYQGFTRYWVSTRQTTASEVPGGAAGGPWQEASLLANTLALAERWKSWSGTQAQYNAIPVKDPQTLYAITG